MSIPLIDRAETYGAALALLTREGRLTYRELLDASARAALSLLDGRRSLEGERVAFLVPPGTLHVVTQWGVWRAGGIAVPLCSLHPPAELDYVLGDADVSTVVGHPDSEPTLRPLADARGARYLSTDVLTACAAAPLPDVAPHAPALLVYTSGTTGRPKGAVSTHAIIDAQARAVVAAWRITPKDHLLHVLPLHHLHGILNALTAPLWAGATVELLPRFDAAETWTRFVEGEAITLFMAVPTIYARLTRLWRESAEADRARMSAGARRLRLMVSGSAALPVATHEQWRQISGHTLLERYGMTEIGMALGNPLDGPRLPGTVGLPFPDVEVRIVDDTGKLVSDGSPGHLQVRGPAVFHEYWRRPEATAEAFTRDGWFQTGDVAACEGGVYRLLGRASIDILKTGGYKVSALEIEDVLRTHEAITDCAVVGLPDPEWGQRVAVAATLEPGASLSLDELRAWAKERLATYKVPTRLSVVDALPRNALGKVQKPEVARLFDGAR